MKTIAEDESYPRVQASSETSRSCVKRTKQREGISSERLATTQKVFFSILMYLTSPRFWTFFTRQKTDLRFLKKRRVFPHLQRGRRNTSVPSIQMFWAAYLQHFRC